MKPNAKAQAILEHIFYATLATTDAAGNPWNSPVYYVYDEAYNLYWASDSESQHSKNIRTNPRVFIVIYDSTAPWGTGRGIYIQAKAAEVTDVEEVTKACRLRQDRISTANQPPDDFIGNSPRRMYRATPEHIWMNNEGKKNGQYIDVRTIAEEQ